MKRLIVLVICTLCAISLNAATIHVPADQPTIQAGIDGTVGSDTVLVADGIYTGLGNRDIHFGGKNIVLQSENGPYATIIDCQSSGRAFTLASGEDSTTVIGGFTIRSGVSNFEGGAMYMMGASPTVRNCIFEHDSLPYGCTSDIYGGAIYCFGGSPIIKNCIFRHNIALGLIWAFAYGGAVYARECQLTFQGCTFDTNFATEGSGGALYAVASTILMEDCRFVHNISTDGGAVTLEASSGSIGGCLFEGNLAAGAGGAIDLSNTSTVEITDCAFIRNHGNGGGIYHSGGGVSIITNATFFGNFSSLGGASCLSLSSGCTTTVTNSIFSFSGEGEVVKCTEDGTTSATLSCCDVYGNTSGDWTGCIVGQEGINGNFSADPLFCDTVEGSFYVDSTSPCAPWNNECGILVGAFDPGCPCCVGLRGDVDGVGIDGCSINVVDVTYLVRYLFLEGPQPPCEEEADVDGSDQIDVVDVTYLVAYLFQGGPAPPRCP